METVPAADDAAVISLDADFIGTHVERAVATFLSRGEGPEAQAHARRARELTPLVELRRSDLVGEHRALPGSLVVPV